MKNLFVIPILFLLNNINAQVESSGWKVYTCYKISGKDTISIPCEEHPYIISNTHSLNSNKINVDSLCHQMSLNLFKNLNDFRRRSNLGQLTYDSLMFRNLTHPHNLWQLRVGRISHSEDFRSYSERTKLRGYSGVAECVAYNRRFDDKDISNFFIQYRNSPSHWEILTNPRYKFISISTVYNKKEGKFYSTVNLR